MITVVENNLQLIIRGPDNINGIVFIVTDRQALGQMANEKVIGPRQVLTQHPPGHIVLFSNLGAIGIARPVVTAIDPSESRRDGPLLQGPSASRRAAAGKRLSREYADVARDRIAQHVLRLPCGMDSLAILSGINPGNFHGLPEIALFVDPGDSLENTQSARSGPNDRDSPDTGSVLFHLTNAPGGLFPGLLSGPLRLADAKLKTRLR